MSYILDALKRAEAERGQGAIPGLHAKQLASYDEPDPRTSPPWLWLLAAAALVLVAGGAGYWWWRAPTKEVVASAPATPAKMPAPEGPVAAAALPAVVNNAASRLPAKTNVPSKPLSGPPPVVAVQVAPQPSAAKRTVAEAPAVPIAAAPATAPVPAPAQVAAVKPPALPAPVPTAAVHPGKGQTGSGIPMLSELPEALRRQIPPLAIAGAVYSDEPSQRMLIINNQTFGQGNVVGSGVQLEEIHSNSSIFNFQGTRFQLDH
jgi:general secretion pathway protein B